ncbi:hypothetical protein [Streptomyces glaucescens]|nr:hypothetical protein [Streptomyces glaucescens]
MVRSQDVFGGSSTTGRRCAPYCLLDCAAGQATVDGEIPGDVPGLAA